jgi:hypothetical protein
MDRLMTVNDVHERTRFAVQTIYSMVSAGKVPFGKVGSRLLFIEMISTSGFWKKG